MLQKILEFLLGNKEFLKQVSKRLVAFFLSTLATIAPFLAQMGLNINIDENKLTEYLISIIALAVTYILSETHRPSKKVESKDPIEK